MLTDLMLATCLAAGQGGITVPVAPKPPAPTVESALRGELLGRVVEVSGRRVRLDIPDRLLPRSGDAVEFFRHVAPGKNVRVGAAKVSSVEGDTVWAEATEGEVARGAVALVATSMPPESVRRPGPAFRPRPLIEAGDPIELAFREASLQAEAATTARQAFAEGQRLRSAERLRSAARLNHAGAALSLYRLLAAGEAKPSGEAMSWLRRAAELGSAEAQSEMGAAVERAGGDPAVVKAWRRQAAR